VSLGLQRALLILAVGCFFLAIAFCYGCAPVETRPPPEPQVQTVLVDKPVPVPCFTEAERPVPPVPTPIDLDHATVDQMAAALAADSKLDELYAQAVDALYLKCLNRTKEPAP